MICPKDGKPCCDDLCYGGGCLELEGAPMLYRCPGCGVLISDEDDLDCTCEPYDYWEDDLPDPA